MYRRDSIAKLYCVRVVHPWTCIEAELTQVHTKVHRIAPSISARRLWRCTRTWTTYRLLLSLYYSTTRFCLCLVDVKRSRRGTLPRTSLYSKSAFQSQRLLRNQKRTAKKFLSGDIPTIASMPLSRTPSVVDIDFTLRRQFKKSSFRYVLIPPHLHLGH